jgi:hypothetical protein
MISGLLVICFIIYYYIHRKHKKNKFIKSIRTKQNRYIKVLEVTNKLFKTSEGTKGRCELDSHADTCVVGSNFRAWEFTGITCDVSPFTEEYEAMKDVPIVTAATAWTNDDTDEAFILIFHQVLWYGKKMANGLLNTNQI